MPFLRWLSPFLRTILSLSFLFVCAFPAIIHTPFFGGIGQRSSKLYLNAGLKANVRIQEKRVHQMEYIRSTYSSSFLRLIKRLEPTQSTKGQDSLLDNFRNLLIPIPEYAAASSSVKLLFSQIGTSYFNAPALLSPISHNMK